MLRTFAAGLFLAVGTLSSAAAEMYEVTLRSPDDRIGSVGHVAFIRAVEAVGQAEVFGE